MRLAGGFSRSLIPWRGIALAAGAVLLAVFLLAPFGWLARTSFLTEPEALSVPPHWIPEQPTLDNYLFYLNPQGTRVLYAARAVQNTPRALLNSTIIAGLVTITNLVVGSSAAYALVRLRFRGSSALLLFYLASRMVPSIAIMIPIYVVVARLGLLDNLLALIIAHTTLTLPFTIWILKSYFQTIPQELEDAARVDRCNRFQAVVRVLLPVSVPGLIAAGMFAFMSSWSEFLFSASLTRTIAATPMTVVVSNLATDQFIEYSFLASAGVLSVVPPLVLALIFQRLIVQGMVSGSLKG